MPIQAFTTDTLVGSLQGVWFGVLQVLPKIVFAIIFILIGLLIGWLAKHAIMELFKALKIDKLLAHTGLDEAIHRAGYKLDSGYFVGEIVRWFFIIVFLIFSFDILNLTQINLFLRDIALTFIPDLIVAVLILFAGSILADFLSQVVAGGAKMLHHKKTSQMLGTLVHWSIWIFAIIVALDQVGIASFYLKTFYQAIVFMIALAGALAFGLGGKEAAADILKHMKKSIKHE